MIAPPPAKQCGAPLKCEASSRGDGDDDDHDCGIADHWEAQESAQRARRNLLESACRGTLIADSC